MSAQPQSRASYEALRENLRKEALYRHQVMSTLPERLAHDRRFVSVTNHACECPSAPAA